MIIVTGASGYIGSALVPFFKMQGYSVRRVSRKVQVDDTENIAADLRDPTAWRDVLSGSVGLVHLSSRTDLRAAEADVLGDDDLNVAPVRSLLLAAKQRGGTPLPVIFASTATIYGDNPSLPCDETSPDRPLSVYDRHKLECEHLLKQASHDGIIAACSLRLANVYGRTDASFGTASINNNRGILNAMMARAMRGEALTVYGAGNYARDFIHLDDVVRAFAAALDTSQVRDGSSYIIATGKGHTLRDAFSMVAQEAKFLTGRDVEIRHVPEPADLHLSERRNFVGNPALFVSRTKWKPDVDLQTGIRRVLRSFPAIGAGVSNG